MIKISVIIPVYNAERFLPQCLSSILKQTLREMEVICIDDGSVDRSVEIIESYQKKDDRIRLLEQNHMGGGAARNAGLATAKGEFLSFLDADDFFAKDMLQKVYEKCKANHADIGIFKVNFYHQSTGAVTKEKAGMVEEFLPQNEVFSYKDMPDYIFNAFHNWAWNKLFRREFIIANQIKFQELRRTNDLLFTTKALILAQRMVVVKERLIFYRVQVSGNCQSTNSNMPYDFYEAFKALKVFLVENGGYDSVRRSYVNHALDGCIANLGTLEFCEQHEQLFDKLKQEIFCSLDIEGHKKEYFYDFNIENRAYEKYKNIMEKDYKLYLMYRAEQLRVAYRDLQFTLYNEVAKTWDYRVKKRIKIILSSVCGKRNR